MKFDQALKEHVKKVGGRKKASAQSFKTMQSLIKDGEKFIGHTFKGKYLDCGTMEGYIKSSMEMSKI